MKELTGNPLYDTGHIHKKSIYIPHKIPPAIQDYKMKVGDMKERLHVSLSRTTTCEATPRIRKGSRFETPGSRQEKVRSRSLAKR